MSVAANMFAMLNPWAFNNKDEPQTSTHDLLFRPSLSHEEQQSLRQIPDAYEFLENNNLLWIDSSSGNEKYEATRFLIYYEKFKTFKKENIHNS